MELKEEFCQDASQAQDANHKTSSRCDKSWHRSRFIRDFRDFVIFFYQLIVRFVLQTDVNKVNIQVLLVVYWKWRRYRLVRQTPTTNIQRPRRICCWILWKLRMEESGMELFSTRWPPIMGKDSSKCLIYADPPPQKKYKFLALKELYTSQTTLAQ